MLELLEIEIRTTMALLGARTTAELTDDLLEAAQPLGALNVLSAFPLLQEDY
jgi:isopentenyl diphosphate isomerase/L-lactate dehydrogenase-like FMN-dependent dehydrogenase